ncbi:Tetratricopeptide TPR_2 repeat protein [Ectocarpus siliculosus]|uniref:Tetratricopeptide TPR_2 repeat protein n=1 Tax=Ectocarpus siliculosus TaxID=2880 RepID=D8LL79_ECTSI|nr:Tetratricopeptide TPR_2 repeat protein [Ectocarpus siliculosus]|eukprot:CBN76139.1 Tetratricopeptide TPR_2 repeat protein [Ectocarpus siliculosus]
MVGLAGPSGVGESTAAGMVVRRTDVRAHFHKGVLWLQDLEAAEAVMTTLERWSILTVEDGRTAKAEELHRRELAIREGKLDEDHPDVADTLNWLAVNVGDAGRKEEAEKLFRQALAIRDEKLGIDHWDTAITRKALAQLHKSTLAVVTQTVAVLLAGVVLYVTISAIWGEDTVVNGFS